MHTNKIFNIPNDLFSQIQFACDDLIPPNDKDGIIWPTSELYEKYFDWFLNSCQDCKTFDDFKHRMGKCYNKLYDEKVFTITFHEFGQYYHDVISSRHVTFTDNQKSTILKYAQARVCIMCYNIASIFL